MKLTRRELFKTGAVMASAYFLPPALRRARAGGAPEKVLVAIFLRGGADPLNLVVPAFDPTYYAVRPDIAIAAGSEIQLGAGDSHGFGLFPLCTDMKQMYDAEELLILHLAGSTDPSRSHFDAQDFMEKAAPGNRSITDGWLNRYLQVINNSEPVAGLSISDAPQLALRGEAPNVAFSSIASFKVVGDFAVARRTALENLYAGTTGVLAEGVNAALSSSDVIQAVSTATSVSYPNNKLAKALKDIAAIIKAEIGVKVVAVDLGGWDHHTNLNTQLGTVGGEDGDGKAVELNGALKAFRDDLFNSGGTNYLDQTLSLCMTEFGRRVAQNGGAGTDHGHGGVMFALGGGIAGGRLLLKDDEWPGLTPPNLFNGEDLQVTTDFRDVFAEALFAHLGMSLTTMAPIFPGFTAKGSAFPGLYPL
ncbi:MAG TPA: DUF1501 domain-containing protein [Terriglobales bacterium]|nr:DUF1501 domain-containing protein [Terriglobales bacterium]